MTMDLNEAERLISGTLLMRDSVTASNIPVDTPVVAGYTNGRYAWKPEDWARFSNSKLVKICIFIPGRSTPMKEDDHVLDTEAGDVNSAQCQEAIDEFVEFKHGIHQVPCIYTSASYLPKVWRPNTDFFLASYPMPGQPYTPHLIPGTVATQYAGDDYFDGLYDESLVVDWWPRQPGGDHTVPNAPSGGIKMTPDGKGYWLWGEDGGLFAYHERTPINLGNPTKDLPAGDKIVGFDCTPTGQGYVFVSAQYNTYSYGDAPVLGHP